MAAQLSQRKRVEPRQQPLLLPRPLQGLATAMPVHPRVRQMIPIVAPCLLRLNRGVLAAPQICELVFHCTQLGNRFAFLTEYDGHATLTEKEAP